MAWHVYNSFFYSKAQAWDWNDLDTTEDHDTSDAISKEKDVESSVNGNPAATRLATDEDSNWDKILRTR